jgi:hypothetical protein
MTGQVLERMPQFFMGFSGTRSRSRKNVLVEMLMVKSSYQGLGDALYLGSFERYPFLEVTKGVEIEHAGSPREAQNEPPVPLRLSCMKLADDQRLSTNSFLVN